MLRSPPKKDRRTGGTSFKRDLRLAADGAQHPENTRAALTAARGGVAMLNPAASTMIDLCADDPPSPPLENSTTLSTLSMFFPEYSRDQLNKVLENRDNNLESALEYFDDNPAVLSIGRTSSFEGEMFQKTLVLRVTQELCRRQTKACKDTYDADFLRKSIMGPLVMNLLSASRKQTEEKLDAFVRIVKMQQCANKG
jgi:hypothetical protein